MNRFWRYGHLKSGLHAIRGAKMRSFWTMSGVIIGVASVISIVSIGEGIKQQISGQIHHLGKDLITIRPGDLQPDSKGDSLSQLSGFSINSPLTQKDVAVVSTNKGVSASAPLAFIGGVATTSTSHHNSGFVVGTDPALASLINQSMAYGDFLENSDQGTNAAVLGSSISEQLFDEDVPLGRSFTFHGQKFIVHGIFNEFNFTPLSQQANFNNAIFIPYNVAESLSKTTAPTYEILARPKNPDETNKVAGELNKALVAAHGGSGGFSVLTGSQNVASTSAVLDLLTRLVAGVAGISLLVGGIGIMNVMMVSIGERTREIGIRKAVGATNRQILSQFMAESAILGLAGGAIGAVLAGLVVIGMRAATDLQPVISWKIVVLATGISLVEGILFGTVPALKAARKAPIEALRSE
ncbi:MAG TPA: ABC transporter permease [Candidatus Saccharimonadales bacterium]|nr:ABC transporter permease [Candidatus Saccharimonadales bacterium]